MSPLLLLTSLSPSPTPSGDDDEAVDIPWSKTLFDGLSFTLSDEENEDEPPSLGEGWKSIKRRRLLDPLGQDEEEEESEEDAEGGGEEKGMEIILFDEADGLILDASRPVHRSPSVSSEEIYDDEEEEDGIPWEREMEDLASLPLEDVQSVAGLDRQETEPDPEDDKPLSLEERRKRAKAYIESVLLSTLRQFTTLVQRQAGLIVEGEEDDVEGLQKGAIEVRVRLGYGAPGEMFEWPRRQGRKGNSKSLARIWRLLALIHEGLVGGFRSTKRDLYYRDPTLFGGSQTTVDRIIDRLVNASGLRRGDFSIYASPKGLFSTSLFDVHLEEDEGVISSNGTSTTIPPGDLISHLARASPNSDSDDESMDLDIAQPEAILVIEKDATFQTLVSRRWAEGKVVLMTGKGFPDLSTRQFVALLSRQFPNTPLYGLFDGDPDGVEILSCFKFGSRKQTGEEESELHVGRMEWLGVRPSEWGALGVDWDFMIPLTERDYKKIRTMLARPADRMPPEWRKELSHMLHLRCKAEIQLLQSSLTTSNGHFEVDDLFDPASSFGQTQQSGADRLVSYLDAKLGFQN